MVATACSWSMCLIPSRHALLAVFSAVLNTSAATVHFPCLETTSNEQVSKSRVGFCGGSLPAKFLKLAKELGLVPAKFLANVTNECVQKAPQCKFPGSTVLTCIDLY